MKRPCPVASWNSGGTVRRPATAGGINNRTFTALNLADVDAEVELVWATQERIIEKSFQYNAVEFGKVTELRWTNGEWVDLAGNRFRR